MSNKPIKLVLFDLGGVLIELGDELFPQEWFPDGQKFGLSEWFSSPEAIKFETGLITTDEFISGLKEYLFLSAPESEILAAFKKWPKGLFSSTDQLINRLKGNYQVAVLSNSNEIHEPIIMHKFGLESMIDEIFFSHLIGYSKPNKEAYNHVLKTLTFAPSEVMFFDDNASNVAAAKNFGMQAFQVSSPLDVSDYI